MVLSLEGIDVLRRRKIRARQRFQLLSAREAIWEFLQQVNRRGSRSTRIHCCRIFLDFPPFP